MRPLVLTVAGAALGLAAVLPIARHVTVPADAGVQVAHVAAPSSGVRPASPPAVTVTATVTATGPVVATRYGPVQVRVVTAGERLVSAQAVRLPDADDQSRQINRYAGPVLARQSVASQGVVDTVSGATWTSEGYRRSLQAALDAARAAATTQTAAG